jgi:glycosyltransferase involved in cell wall biosynthesis
MNKLLIEQCIKSINYQTYSDWECRVVCDPCDDSYKVAKKLESDKLKVIKKAKREYQLKNLIDGLDDMNPASNDVVVVIDGDDRLIRPDAFNLVVTEYMKGMLVTHGTYVLPQDDTKYAEAFHKDATNYKTQPIRKIDWKTSHLRTFKYGIFDKISDDDLRDPEGKYFKAAADQAVMFPVIEMAGPDKVGFITEAIYLYNHNMKSSLKNKAKSRNEQKVNSEFLRAKKPYDKLTDDISKMNTL